MKWLFSLLLLTALPALAQVLPPSPPGAGSTKLLSPKHAEHLASLGATMVKAAVAPAQPQLWLTWDYPADQITNVVFEVWHSMSPSAGPPLTRWDQIPSGFTLLTTVDAPPVSVGGLAQEYFVNRAKDRISGVYSNWNVP
jgi:hypothetical protein